MVLHEEAKQTVSVSNGVMYFTLDYSHGLLLRQLSHVNSGLQWLRQPSEIFELRIRGAIFPASQFTVTDVLVTGDGNPEVAAFTLLCQEWDVSCRVSLVSGAEESYTLLIQMGARWPQNAPEEAYLRMGFFEGFGPEGSRWYLSANPVPKPDGTSAMNLHDDFDLPICSIAPDIRAGFSLELRDYSQHVHFWNQNRNCDLLHKTDEMALINDWNLIRLSNEPLADVIEIRFFALSNGWEEAFRQWKRRVRSEMNLEEYQRPDLQWYRQTLFQHFTFAYSSEVFNYEDGRFDLDRLLDQGVEFGGYDSVILWFQYPRLGVDERKQWEFNHDIPDGVPGLKRLAAAARARGVRVFLPYNPWDTRADESLDSIIENMVTLVRETDVDGIWFDTMATVPDTLREQMDEAHPGVVFCTEHEPAARKSMETITGSWDQLLRHDIMPEASLLRYLFPEHNAPVTSRWQIGEGKDTLIKRAVFNGTGLVIWQDVFGAWMPFSQDQRASIRKWKGILLENWDIYSGSSPIPLYPTFEGGLYANRFVSDDGKGAIYSLYNATDQMIEGPLLTLKEKERDGVELWRGAALLVRNGLLDGAVEPQEVLLFRAKSRA